MKLETEEKIAQLEAYKKNLQLWRQTHDGETRSLINQTTVSTRREVIESGCFQMLTIGPPPAIGGLIVRNIDPFNVIFNSPYEVDIISFVIDMIDETIGVLRTGPSIPLLDEPEVQININFEKGYAFIAMPINSADLQLEDVLDAIKEAANRCGINAERVDEPQSNERITDRIKDYPVIFFRNMKELKDGLEKRLRGLAEERRT